MRSLRRGSRHRAVNHGSIQTVARVLWLLRQVVADELDQERIGSRCLGSINMGVVNWLTAARQPCCLSPGVFDAGDRGPE
jgi:hypothetical protein